MLRFLFLLPICLAFISHSPLALAQENLDDPADLMAPKEEPAIRKKDMSDIPDEYIMEATQYGEECRNDDKLPLYFDCRCMTVHYLDVRKKLGPEASVSAVRSQLGGRCKDGTGIAGVAYEKCLGNFLLAPKNVNLEDFCGCYSNRFAKMYESLPGAMSARAEIALKSRARTECASPETARRIYGIRPR